MYLFFAYAELASFYVVGYDNHGRFPIRYSLVKKFFVYSFYTLLVFFVFIYVSMVWFSLVWAVLAAILNPSVFLPYSTAALTLITTITAKNIYYKRMLDNLTKNFDKIIVEKIGTAF